MIKVSQQEREQEQGSEPAGPQGLSRVSNGAEGSTGQGAMKLTQPISFVLDEM